MDAERALVRHAITPPTFEAGWLHRSRLVDLLLASIPQRFITITAPAGYGKSTLLADFCANTDLPVCWIRVTEADKDLMRLAAVFAASLGRVFPGMHDRLLRRIQSGSDIVALARTFSAELQDSIDTPVVLIMDDVHHLDWEPVPSAMIQEIADCFSEQVILIQSGRRAMHLPYAILIGEGRIASLGARELALDRQEVQELARFKLGLELSGKEAQRILDVSNGWIMGVSMMLEGDLSCIQNISMCSETEAHEYMIAEVLNRQPGDLQRFMVESSVMPAMTGAACDEVLQRAGSDHVLQELVNRGVFIMCSDGIPKSYEYHPQFRSVLLETLQQEYPERCKVLRTRAAECLMEHGMVEHAVALHLEAGNVDQAVSLAEMHARTMLAEGRDHTLQQWVEIFTGLQASIPSLLATHAYLLLRRGEHEAAARALERARSCITKRTSKTTKAYCEGAQAAFLYHVGRYRDAETLAEKISSTIGARGSRWMKASLLCLQGMCALTGSGDFGKAERFLTEAASLAKQDTMQLLLIMILNALTSAQIAQGRLQAAYQTTLKGYDIIQSRSLPAETVQARLLVSRVAHLLGNLEEALQQLDETLELIANTSYLGSGEGETEAVIEKGGLLSALGLHEEAEGCLRQGYAQAGKNHSTKQVMHAISHLVRNFSRQGDAESAKSILEAQLPGEEDEFGEVALRIERAVLNIHSDPALCKQQLEEILEREQLDVRGTVHCKVFLASASLRLGDRVAAKDILDEAFATASFSGQVQTLTTKLSFQPELLRLARAEFGGSPTMLKIEDGLRSMKVLADQLRSKMHPQEAPNKQLSIDALGKMSVQFGGEILRGPKPRALHVLCYLVDRGQENRDVLLEKFWPGHPPGKGVANLHADVYSLRRAIGKQAIQLEGTTYRMNGEVPIRFDVAEFETAAVRATRISNADPRRFDLLRRAVESYKGPFLPGVPAEWARARREKLEMAYLDLLVDHAKEALLQDRPGEALKSLRKALIIDVLREDTNAQLMEALGRLGRKSELSVHYHRYVHTLRDELGIDPAEIVRKAYARWTDDIYRKPEGEQPG